MAAAPRQAAVRFSSQEVRFVKSSQQNSFITLAVILLAGLGPTMAHAQVFGQFTPAEPLAVNAHSLGVYLDTSSKTLGTLGQLRLSFYPGVDFGFQMGFARRDLSGADRTTVRFGADVKAAVVREGEASQYAISVGGAIGVESSDQFSLVTLAPQAVVSRGYRMGEAVNVRPYAGAQVAFSHSTILGHDLSDMSVPLRVGAEFEAGPSVKIVFELQYLLGTDLNDRNHIVAGVNLPF